MGKGRRYLGNIHKKVGNFRENDDESRDNCKNDENRQKLGELAGRYCNKRRLIDGKRRGTGKNWKLAFNDN